MKTRVFMGDFETTVYKGQTSTEVWASACVEMQTEDVFIFHSIEEQFNYFVEMPENIICYYHNLKFDGSFWLDYLICQRGFEQAYTAGQGFLKKKEMLNNTVRYVISNMGQWYSIIVKVKGKFIEFRDSLKLLPFSVKEIGESFKTKHKKLDMEYEGYRYAGCYISDSEKEYIANDVLVVKEALEILFSEGHNKTTIGSCCLAEYKNIIGGPVYNRRFPNLYEIELNEGFDAETVGDYIRGAYHGGWCYVVHGKEGKHTGGVTCDVNSLYPSVMSGESLSRYPTGTPRFWKGDYIPKEAKLRGSYYFVRIRTRFHVKEGYLPFIQIKHNLLYKSTESLTTSDIYYKKENKYYRYYVDSKGERHEAKVTLTLTMTDWELIQEHYILEDCEILDGCYFAAQIGIFDEYIEKYKKIKMTSTGAIRQLAKLFLNNLYGKMAASTDSSYKVAFEKNEALSFADMTENKKTPGYIAVGAAITAYAKAFTVRAAQANYYGVNKRGFIYADTDSIHVDLPLEQIKGIKIHETDFCCWKIESEWDEAIFTRQKTYIEHVVKKDGKEIEPFYDIKCAGMPKRCKELFEWSITEVPKDEKLTEEEQEFLKTKRKLTDFTLGLKVPSKLLPKRIKGGVVLCSTTYEMR